MREVRVVDEAGAAVPGATVWFVKPGWAYADLPAEQADRYSRSTESWLRDFGLARITDERGSTSIPIAAAQQVVVARKGELYGTNWPRSEGAFQPIVVTARPTLVVETVDELGAAVPHVTVVGQPVSASRFADPMAQWTLGTTDEHGRLTTILEAPSGPDPAVQIRLHAELLDGPHGELAIDAKAPPTFVRLVLPPTGTVRVRIEHVGGSSLDRRMLATLTAELGVVGARPQATMFALLGGASPALRYEHLDAEGNACFANVAFGQKLQLRLPGMVVTPKVFAGPTATQREVAIVYTLDAEHPFVVGTLVDPGGRPVADATFTVMAPGTPDLLLSVAGRTDALGRFVAWLTDRCLGQRDVVLQLGMDWGNSGPLRQVTVTPAGPLLGKVDLGTVVMPDPK
jgi:hypothetical protein